MGKRQHTNPPAKETEKIAGYKPETLLKAPLEPPQMFETRPEPSAKHSREIRRNHNVFGLFLVLAGVGVLVLLALAILFLPSFSTTWIATMGVLGLAALAAGLTIDAIYRASYEQKDE